MSIENSRIKDVISICFCIDQNYVNYLGAVINSIVESNHMNAIHMIVMSSNVEQASKVKLEDIVRPVPTFSIEFSDVAGSDHSDLEAGGHISSATYIRFSIPDIISERARVLYLDSDVIVSGDLRELWEYDVSTEFVGAVENPLFNRYEQLGIDPESGYFNAGVLLMNLDMWRKFDIKEKAIDFLRANKAVAKMFDQDALNAVMRGQWKRLPIKWNLQTIYLRRRKSLPRQKEEITNACKAPGIIHFSTSSKPWDFLDPHPLRSHYIRNERKFGIVRKKLTLKGYLRSVIKWLYLTVAFKYQLCF